MYYFMTLEQLSSKCDAVDFYSAEVSLERRSSGNAESGVAQFLFSPSVPWMSKPRVAGLLI
jgi:hypothetical protein